MPKPSPGHTDIHVKFPDRIARVLRDYAAAHDIHVSRFIRRAVLAELRRAGVDVTSAGLDVESIVEGALSDPETVALRRLGKG